MKFWESRTVLVTGGCGFVGSYLVEELVKEGAEVSVVDNLEAGKVDNIASVAGSVRFTEADLIDFDACMSATQGIDTVINAVGRTRGVGYCSNHHGEMLFNNTAAQINMLEAARRNGVKRFTVISSSCVYPDDAPAPTPELPVVTELPESVSAGYGWAKRVAELQAMYYSREYGIATTICRPANIYGGRYLWRGEEDSHVVPVLVKKILDGQDPVVVWGDGRQSRDFVHGRDAAMYLMMLTERCPPVEAVNIGSGEDVSIRDLLSVICRVSGLEPEILYDTSKPVGRRRKCADVALLRELTDNTGPRIGLDEGIRDMVRWYQRLFEDG